MECAAYMIKKNVALFLIFLKIEKNSHIDEHLHINVRNGNIKHIQCACACTHISEISPHTLT